MRKIIGITAACTLLGGVLAAPAWALDKNDSVRSWGRWESMVAPAAGPEVDNTPVALLSEDGLVLRPEDGGPLSPQVVDPENPVDPIPVDPIPVDPIPVDPIPVDPIPVDPTPIGPPVLVPGTPTPPLGGPIDRPPRGAPI